MRLMGPRIRYSRSTGLRALAPVALEPQPELLRRRGLAYPVRHLLSGFALEVLAHLLEKALAVAPPRPLGITAQALAQSFELFQGTIHAVEVRQAKPTRAPLGHPIERMLPGLDVDVRRGRGRERELIRRDPNAGHIADVGIARILVEVCDVVLRV